MKETAIDILGLHLQEPVTVVTNLLITVSCILLYFKLNVDSHRLKLKKYWRLFFVFFGVSALIGAFAHGFKSYFEPNVFYYIWMTMNLSALPITYFLFKANITLTGASEKYKQQMHYFVISTILVFVIITVLTNNFVAIKIVGGIAILTTIITHTQSYRKKIKGSGWITFGFTFSISTLIIHTAKISFSDWFNFKDISHVLMNISLCFIFIGVKQKLLSFNGGEPIPEVTPL